MSKKEKNPSPAGEQEQAPQEGGLYAELMELNRSGNQEQTRPEEDDETEEPTRRIDFDHLQFGKDYEIR